MRALFKKHLKSIVYVNGNFFADGTAMLFLLFYLLTGNDWDHQYNGHADTLTGRRSSESDAERAHSRCEVLELLEAPVV